MNLKSTLASLAICSTFLTFAQEEEIKLNREVDFSLNYHLEWQYHDIFSRAEWNVITPGYLNGDQIDSTYNGDFYLSANRAGGMGFSLSVNLNKKDEAKSNFAKFLRFSYNGGEGFYASKDWTKSEVLSSDTLKSNNSATIFYIDSTSFKTYSKTYRSGQQRLSFAYIIQMDRTKRFSLYAGLGLGVGFSSWAESTVLETNRMDISVHDSLMNFNSTQSMSVKQPTLDERIRLKNNKSFQIYAPIGVDIKLSKRSTFLEKFILSVELGFAFNWFFIPELDTFNNQSFRFQSSLKYRF